MAMQITLNVNVLVKDGALVLTDHTGKPVTFSKEQTVQQKVSMIVLGELCDLPKRQLATGFGFKTRKSYYDIRTAVLNGSLADLLPKRPAPRTSPKRTKEVEACLIRTRFETELNMYEIAEALTHLGFNISARLVGQGLADYGLAKKRGSQASLPARLLVQEEIEILDGACKPPPRLVTRHDIDRDVTTLLTRGLTTTSAGGFFFLPYLLQLGASDLVASLGPTKHAGLPPERLALGLVFESIFGYTVGIRAVDAVSRTDFGLLAGLPFLPSPSTQYRFLQDVSVQDSLDFQTALGQRLVGLGQITLDHPVNVDAHNMKTYSRKAMKHAFMPQEDRYGKAIRTFYTQDQTSKKPLIALAAYSGTTVSQVTHRLATLTRAILGRDFLLVADKEWYCGQLIQELHAQYGIAILTPVKSSPKRLKEFDAVPLEQYDKTVWGNVAAVYTTMTHFDGPLRMLLKKRRDGKYFALITPACDMTADTAMPIYTKRWRIENFFAENAFLGVNHLPSLNLNAIQTMLSLRLLAFHVMDNFRHDLGPAYQHKTPELIHRAFIDGVQGRVQLRGNLIEVSVYGFEHETAAAAILTNLDTKLENAGVDPCIPWLGNRRLRFTFH